MKKSIGSVFAVFVLALGMCGVGALPATANLTSVTYHDTIGTPFPLYANGLYSLSSNGNGEIIISNFASLNPTVSLTNYVGGPIKIDCGRDTTTVVNLQIIGNCEVNGNNPIVCVGNNASTARFTIGGPGNLTIGNTTNNYGIPTDGDLEIIENVSVIITNPNRGIQINNSNKRFKVQTFAVVRIESTNDNYNLSFIQGILFFGGKGEAKGNCVLNEDLNIRGNETLTILPSATVEIPIYTTMTVSSGGKIVNNGTINGKGKLNLQSGGSITGSGNIAGTIQRNNPGSGGGGCVSGAFGVYGLAALALAQRLKRGNA